jgi:hypothetical protein
MIKLLAEHFFLFGYSKVPSLTLSFDVLWGATVDKSGEQEDCHYESQDSMPTGQSSSSQAHLGYEEPRQQDVQCDERRLQHSWARRDRK